jgi:hypothetical protein
MMRLHRRDNAFIDAVFFKDPSTYFNVRALHLMVYRFADIMEKGPCTSDSDICTKFSREHAGDMSHFNRVLEDVLSEASTEVETSKERNKFWVEPNDSGFVRCRFAFLLHEIRNFCTCLLNSLLYLRWLNTTICNEFLERYLRYGTTKGIKGRECDPVGHIINNDIDTRCTLKRFDITTFLTNYFSFYIF